MKLKTQTEILENQTTHYKTKYQEIDQELIAEIRELYPIETQPLLKINDGIKQQKGGRKILNKKKQTPWLP